jgi:hypothetical protein
MGQRFSATVPRSLLIAPEKAQKMGSTGRDEISIGAQKNRRFSPDGRASSVNTTEKLVRSALIVSSDRFSGRKDFVIDAVITSSDE